MAAKGVIIFLVVYFSIVALFLGFNLKEIISKDYPGIPPVQAFNSLLFIYAGFELVLRVMMQNLPTFGFQPFLVIPVKRKRIAHYMLNKSLLHFFNVLPLLLLLPFTFTVGINELPALNLACWFLAIYFMVFVNHYLALYIKWRTNESNLAFYGFLALSVAVYCIDYFGLFDITAAFGRVFDFVALYPVTVLGFPLLAGLFYILNKHYLLSRFYLDELGNKKKLEGKYDFSWLNRVGNMAKCFPWK